MSTIVETKYENMIVARGRDGRVVERFELDTPLSELLWLHNVSDEVTFKVEGVYYDEATGTLVD